MKKYIGLEDMSHVNCSNVLHVIRNHGEISRKQISELTGLSWGGMTKIVNKLFENEYIVEEKNSHFTGNGRIPNVIRINEKKHFVIGADINQTGLRAYVTDLSGKKKQEYFEENHYKNKDELLDRITKFFKKIFRDFPENIIRTAGIAMQGKIDAQKGISIRFPGCADWSNVPIADILKEKFGIHVCLEHDPDCMLFSELKNKKENLLLFRLDQSVGMAVSIDGKILKGTGILEIAHNLVIPNGKPCECGLSGCLEAYVRPCINDRKVNEQAIDEMIYPLAVMIFNMTSVFHADTVILTGDLISFYSLFEKKLTCELEKLQGNKKIEIKFTGDVKIAVKGAALIAAEQAIDTIRL